MRAKIFLCILLSTLFFYVQAQKDFRPAYIITTENDTIQGSIEVRNSLEFHQKIKFKDSNEQIKEYTTEELKGFLIENKVFFEAVSCQSGNEHKTLFLQRMIEGTISLYQSVDESGNKDIFYLQKQGEKALQLPNSNSYTQYLKYAFADCEDMKFNPNTLYSYNYKVLEKLIIKYNTCKGDESPKIVREKINLIIDKGIIAGYFPTTISIPSRLFQYNFNNPHFSDKYNTFTFGANIDFKFYSKLSINLGMLYTPYKINYKDYPNKDAYVRYNFDMDLKLLDIPLVVKYYFTQNKIKPYLYAGFRNTIVLSEKYHTKAIRDDGMIVADRDIDIGTLTLRSIDLLTGLGISYDITSKTNIFVDIRYNKIRLRNNIDDPINISGIQFLTGINF